MKMKQSTETNYPSNILCKCIRALVIPNVANVCIKRTLQEAFETAAQINEQSFLVNTSFFSIFR